MKYLFFLLIFCLTNICCGQKLVISPIQESHSSALKIESFPKDLNDELCAAIIVNTNGVAGLNFSGNIVGPPSYENGTYLIFVSKAKRIRFRHENYEPGTIEYSEPFASGKIYSVSIIDAENTSRSSIFVSSVPQGLDVFIDHELVGKTPFKMENLWSGQYMVNVKHPSGKVYSQTINVVEEKEYMINARFSTNSNILFSFNCHHVDEIVIDGISCGSSIADTNDPMVLWGREGVLAWLTSTYSKELPVGIHHIKLKANGYETIEQDVMVDEHDKKIDFALKPKVEKIKIDVKGVTFEMCNVQHGCGNEFSVYPYCVPGFWIDFTKDFYIGTTEVTRLLWNTVMGYSISKEDPNKPIVNVSYYECRKFIEKLNKITGLEFRLPTVAEWQYACQGGIYKDAEKDMHKTSWTLDDGLGEAHDIARRPPNSIGLYDMAGNVKEFCEDWFVEKYARPSYVVKDFVGPKTGDYVLARGYSFKTKASMHATSITTKMLPTEKFDDCGFRLLLEVLR